jgi:glycosyltransferase involved in cell wall biosynthesis
MLLGKPTIVAEAPGVRDYVEDGETALVVERDAAAMRAAIEWVLDPANREAVEAMGTAGRRSVEERFLRPNYYRQMYEEAVSFWQRRTGRNGRISR